MGAGIGAAFGASVDRVGKGVMGDRIAGEDVAEAVGADSEGGGVSVDTASGVSEMVSHAESTATSRSIEIQRINIRQL